MNEFLQTKKMQLKCLAPIHIGSGNKLSKNELFLMKIRDYLFITANKWLQFLQDFNPANEKKETSSKSGSQIKGFVALAQVLGHKSKDIYRNTKNILFVMLVVKNHYLYINGV
ncbi:hypothetical protein [Pectinatus brassicae]|uniref:hypothetical protein n=1 Tax=Pectinatus brassicae TaxID=862415 RepID=UPI0018C81D3C|nr:hypothetical protein [Pectinatus brassicae]